MLTAGIMLTIISPYTVILPLLYMVYKVRRDKLSMPRNPWNIGLVFVFAWALMSGFMNRDSLSMMASFAVLIYLGAGIYIQRSFDTDDKVESLVRSLIAMSLVAAGLGIGERVAAMFFDMSWISKLYWSPTYIPLKESYRIYSTFGNPNVAGDWFAAVAIASMYFFDKESGKKKIAYALGTMLFIGMLMLTGSKGAVVGFVAAVMAYALFKRSKGSLILVGATLLVVVFMVLVLPVANHPINSRNSIWAFCLALIDRKPITGWGLIGIFTHSREIHGHNIWITILATLGFVGLGAYLFMRFYLYKALMTLRANGHGVAALLAAIQALIVVHGLVDFTMIAPQSAIIFFGSAAIISGLASGYYPVEDVSPRYVGRLIGNLLAPYSYLIPGRRSKGPVKDLRFYK